MASKYLCLALLLAIVTHAPAHAAEEAKPYLGKVLFGIEGEAVPVPADPRYGSTWGFQLSCVSARSSASEAGLRVGDILVSVDGSVWKEKAIRLGRSFGKAGDKITPGDVVPCLVLRKGDAGAPARLETVRVTLVRYPRTKADEPRPPANEEIRPDLKSLRPAYQDLCWKLIDQAGYPADCADLLARLDRCDQFPHADRLPILRYVLRDPFKLEAVGRELAGPLAGGAAGCDLLLAQAERALLTFAKGAGEAPRPAPLPPPYAGSDLNGHLQYVEQVLAAAAECHRRAFAALSKEEAQFLRDQRLPLLAAFIEYKMLSYDPAREKAEEYLKVLDLAGKVDLPALFAQARLVALLVAPAFTESLRKAAEASGKDLTAGVVAQRKTAFGEVLVAGRGRNRHAGADYAALFDLGGDDVYVNNQATSVWGSIPTAVIVDYQGDDAYETHTPFSQGCGDMGVGILADLAGSDSYVGLRFSQGTGFCGIGMLLDAAGDDVYRGLQFHQGVGHYGVGILADSAGRDRYEAHTVAQGVGLPGGFGLCCDGGAGADSYYCKGDQASGYGTPGGFEGWGQGVGMGYRPYASGGVGVLVDAGGADRLEGGDFTQGGGYFYGFGVLLNAGADADLYIGSHWAQGFGCHQAAGAFLEEGGDDRYTTRYAVVQGHAWDEAVSLFLDRAGSDRYEGGGFSQGASAHNGWATFLDLAGDDTYLYTDQARAGGNDYHGGKSLSFFVDAGGTDTYPNRPNNRIQFGAENSLFVDAPAGLESLLEEKVRLEMVSDQ